MMQCMGLPVTVAKLFIKRPGPLVQFSRSRIILRHPPGYAQMMQCMGLPVTVAKLFIKRPGPLVQFSRSRIVPHHPTNNGQIVEAGSVGDHVIPQPGR